MKFLNISVFLLAILLTNCVSKPKVVDDGSDKGVWQGNVRIHDADKGKKISGYVTWTSESQKNRLRVDVQAVFGIPVATFILDGDQADLWLHQESKHYTSKSPAKLFANLVRFPLNPKIFFSLLNKNGQFPRPWKCLRQKQRVDCDNVRDKVSLNLKNQSEHRRKIEIRQGGKALAMALTRSKVEVLDKQFKVRKISGYKQISM